MEFRTPKASRRNVVTAAAVSALLLGSHVVVPTPVTRYGSWLAVFSVWMVWFVMFVVDWLRTADV